MRNTNSTLVHRAALHQLGTHGKDISQKTLKRELKEVGAKAFEQKYLCACCQK